MMLTKIVATVGPNILHEEGIKHLIGLGVTVFRFNFKHNSIQWHSDGIDLVNRVAKHVGVPVATIADLQGPSIRVNMPCDTLEVTQGEKIYFGPRVFDDNVKGISLTHPDIISSLDDGQLILVDDGNFRFIFSREAGETYVTSQTTGTVRNKKNLNIPGSDFPFPVLVDRDFEGIALAARSEVDYIALSFVRSAQDIADLRLEMAKYNIQAGVISKIETQKAITHIDEIIEASDVIMVARGDLGVEVPYEEVPFYQKMMIQKCIEQAKPVITATQMLDSMMDKPNATRAEISDVANAVYDLTDAVMLSGETAFGKYPYEAVETMARIASFHEGKQMYDIRRQYKLNVDTDEAKVCDMAYSLFLNYARETKRQCAGFVVFTKSGRTARLMSRYRARPNQPIYAFTHTKEVRDKLAMSFGVKPFYLESFTSSGSVETKQILHAIDTLKTGGYVQSGDYVIVLHGDEWAEEGGTSTVKLVHV